MIRISWMAAALLVAACAQPAADNGATNGEASDNMSSTSVRAASAPPEDKEVPKALPAPAPAPAPVPASQPYTARGQEPGWALTIDKGRIDYQGNYGEKKIDVAAPEPQPIPNGRRYVTDRLTVEIAYERCNDAMSGFGFEHKVKVTADGETYEGCGGKRRTDWDM
jgi:uncharacterized membrane protein